MTHPTQPDRKNFRTDLTRWNRAGLSRFSYVDGNAANWLEELRIGLLSQYLRGIDANERRPEDWRGLFSLPANQLGKPRRLADYQEALAWQALLPPLPAKPEDTRARNVRLTLQYERRAHEYGWEIARAFARASHLLLGHLDAFANEGYLRTATQWDSLRKLAATVNYQPTPPASATSTVALMLSEGVDSVEVAAGLAMKFAPPEGGAPLIFETGKPLKAHVALNSVRAHDWDKNHDSLVDVASVRWHVPKGAQLLAGDAVIFTDGKRQGQATELKAAETNEDKSFAKLSFLAAPLVVPEMHACVIHMTPEDIRPGLYISTQMQTVIKLIDGAAPAINSIVRIDGKDIDGSLLCVVVAVNGNEVALTPAFASQSDVQMTELTSVGRNAKNEFEISPGVEEFPLDKVYYAVDGAVVAATTGTEKKANNKLVSRTFEGVSSDTKIAFIDVGNVAGKPGFVVQAPEGMNSTAITSVKFAGKPPKSLHVDSWFVARPMGESGLTALKVVETRLEQDGYFLTFSGEVHSKPHRTEFLGPMTKVLRPEFHDRNQSDGVAGDTFDLVIAVPEARTLVRPGKQLIIVNDQEPKHRAVGATVVSAETLANGNVRVTADISASVAGWKKGWTQFHLNCTGISHGETQAPRILGSGDAERNQQDFPFKVSGLSFVPSNIAVSGVAPDIDVTVDSVKWAYRDFTDPDADGTESWSIRINDDDTYQVYFRRRLPTGTDNITVPRHRIGVGLAGSGVPAWSFKAPMAKNRHVAAIIQPFATAGGADREAVASVRQNAPQALAANGRAVSLKDFERLCQRHASVWQAKSREIIGPFIYNQVDVIIVPAGGGAVTTRLREDLTDFMASRAIPGVSISISGYEAIPVTMGVKAFVNAARFEKSDVRDELVLALSKAFALERRGLGQPLYIAEILAEGERVTGVESLVVTAFSRMPGAPAVLNEAVIANGLAAIFPKENQVAYLTAVANLTVSVEAIT